MFVDKVSVLVKAGRGGNGAVSFRHEKFVDKGGPDGGDGGNGGDVVLIGSTRQNTLAAFRYKQEVTAKDGSPGSKRKRHGKSAPHLEVLVPVGTVVYDGETLVADITEDGQRAIVAKGGKGGFGNAHFTSSTRQLPRVAEKGEPGQELTAILELKMIAEVGLVGLPNAGKSTLLARISNAKPEIANYPFTTIKPNLGVADVGQNRALLVADIPGLIEGASEGKGLGDDFLRHVERTRVLVHLIDAYSNDIARDYTIIKKELAAYRVDLSVRPEIIAINKTEGLDQDIVDDHIAALRKVVGKGPDIVAISAASGAGVDQVLSKAVVFADAIAEEEAERESNATPVIRLDENDLAWKVTRLEKAYLITGRKIERFALRTDFENFEGIRRLRDIMRKMGIMHELERQKINPDDTILIGKDGKYGQFKY